MRESKTESPRWFLTTTTLVIGIVVTWVLAQFAIGRSDISVNPYLVFAALTVPALIASLLSGYVNGLEEDGLKVSIGVAMGSQAIGWAIAVARLISEQRFDSQENEFVASATERKVLAMVAFCLLSGACAGAIGTIGGLFGGAIGQDAREKIKRGKERRKAEPESHRLGR